MEPIERSRTAVPRLANAFIGIASTTRLGEGEWNSCTLLTAYIECRNSCTRTDPSVSSVRLLVKERGNLGVCDYDCLVRSCLNNPTESTIGSRERCFRTFRVRFRTCHNIQPCPARSKKLPDASRVCEDAGLESLFQATRFRSKEMPSALEAPDPERTLRREASPFLSERR
jgi:hypothetical protein